VTFEIRRVIGFAPKPGAPLTTIGPILTNNRSPLRVAFVVCAFEPGVVDPEELLELYHAPNAWPDALVNAGGSPVVVVQRFRRDVLVRRGEVDYRFVADEGPPCPSPWFSSRRMAVALRGLDPAVVHVDGLLFPLFVRHLRLSLPNQTAILVQDHGGLDLQSPLFESGPRSWASRAFYAAGLRAADGFLFTTREQAVPWQRAGILSRSQPIHEILESSTALAMSSVVAEGNRRLPGRPALLWVGRLDSNKDPLTVLDGFERAAASLPDAELTLVYGDDKLLAEVRTRIEHSTVLRSRVHLRGRMSHRALAGVYAGADAFVLGSHREVACYSLIEALSFGLIPVVTNIPPFRLLTDRGSIGALFPPGNAHALAHALGQLKVIDLPAQRKRVREHFERELSWSVVGTRAMAIYRDAAAARQNGRPPKVSASGPHGHPTFKPPDRGPSDPTI
jgi:glycosyltransferase involved in cell wall biosynthesis